MFFCEFCKITKKIFYRTPLDDCFWNLKTILILTWAEAVAQRCSVKKELLKTLKIQENSCAGVSFWQSCRLFAIVTEKSLCWDVFKITLQAWSTPGYPYLQLLSTSLCPNSETNFTFYFTLRRMLRLIYISVWFFGEEPIKAYLTIYSHSK